MQKRDCGYNSAALYLFRHDEAQSFPGVHQFDEIKEQAAISLLGLPSLPNQARTGAANWCFAPDESHRDRFQGIRTHAISCLDPVRFHPIPQRKTISTWADDIQRYARENRRPVSVFRNRCHDFPGSLKDMVMEQATPAAFDGEIRTFF
ncbi:hypothetical protein ASPWEDRAFT_745951 [Aspergillus wentii DTO 134E9]|uniref:Uncharacterized protein n=1 Tax=Aspergillus wentii DTO 134E9 TaxID=1073089 RepID=A0A1L9RBL6_ASPWE|nr:uncharacterized protein ASPWEDRAFT_745951 [Aspergillus wentii DTO 134E9]OJJ32314.1 hypothetical protein ASPWEDRAFT_745951 [Aspergillus wentii DTO 134E9]